MFHTRKMHVFAGAAAFLAGLATAQDQNAPGEKKHMVDVQVQRFEMPAPGPGAAFGRTFEFISADMNAPGKVVKGAPYQAEAVNESVQTLADGNRIANKSTSAVARDSEGRTRREQSLPAIGPWASQGDAPRMIFINDPVAGVNYVLDERAKMARKIAAAGRVRSPLPEGVRVNGPIGLTAPHGDVLTVVQKNTREGVVREPKIEQLGQRNIEGVVADGTRMTMTIPAGEMGNERPLEVVNERWYSQELQAVVMSKHSDPRFGETTYRLTHISRAEPPRTSFEVPADYQLAEMNGREPADLRINRKQ